MRYHGQRLCKNTVSHRGNEEHYSQIKKLYEKKLVDKSYDGDLEDVEMVFGIRAERSTPLGMSDYLEEAFEDAEQTTSPQKRKDEK